MAGEQSPTTALGSIFGALHVCAAQAMIAQDKKDAERYRKLRDGKCGLVVIEARFIPECVCNLLGEKLDRDLDKM